MGVRPPDDGTDEPSTVAFGIAAVDDRLAETDLAFPATRREVREALGDEAVPYDAAGNTVPVEDVVEAVERDRFETEQDLMNALHPIFEARRRSGGGLLQRLLSILPP